MNGMTPIPSLRTLVGARVVHSRELDRAPRALVDFGQAPDGLPWLCDVDRSSRIDQLYRTIAQLFDCDAVADLPGSVREATEGPLARGLMGVHSIALDTRGPRPAFVTRRSARALFGPTLFEQALAPPSRVHVEDLGQSVVTSANSVGMSEALETAIEATRSNRHVVLTLDGETWTATVTDANRALRVPAPPYRRTVFESLANLAGAQARVRGGYETWTAPLADLRAYVDLLVRAGETASGGAVDFELPRATLLKLLVEVARSLGERHKRGLVHGDVTPGNILLDGTRPTLPDALDVENGQLAVAATFEWAAPEQIVGRPLDPRADVYALGKLACALVGAVPFGEQISYLVPTGGHASKTVELLKTDGVFVDSKQLGTTREWQAAWQDTLLRLVAYDRERRLESGSAAAQALANLVEKYPPPGTLPLAGRFGTIRPLQSPSTWPLARVIGDG
jgi:hypothetical protein